MIAALPMYDRAELRCATDRYWTAVHEELLVRGIDAPDRLTRGRDLWRLWRDPNLVLAQTCGLPFRAVLHTEVTLIGTPDFAVEGCPPGYYRSVMVARSADLPDRVCLAYNEGLSQSGWAAALDWLAETGLRPQALRQTGSHAASVSAVASGQADLAAIDAVTWRLMKAADAAHGLAEVGWTPPCPGLPLIAAKGVDPAPRAEAAAAAIARLAPEIRRALGLRGFCALPASAYLALPVPPDPKAFAAENGAEML